MSKLLLINFLLLIGITIGSSQVNSELEIISNGMSFENDTTIYDTIVKSKSCQYNFTLNEEALIIDSKVTDLLESENQEVVTMISYNIPIAKIKEVELHTVKIPYTENGEDKIKSMVSLKFNALRKEKLFEQSGDVYSDKTSYVRLPIYRVQDSIYANMLIELLYLEYGISDNSIEANCDLKEIQLTPDGKIYSAILSQDLSKAIQLNGSKKVDEELKQILAPVIKENNMASISFQLILGNDNKIIDVGIMEYLLGNEFREEFKDKSESEKKIMLETFGFISKETNDQIIDLLNKQNWTTGYCNGKPSISAYSYDYFK